MSGNKKRPGPGRSGPKGKGQPRGQGGSGKGGPGKGGGRGGPRTAQQRGRDRSKHRAQVQRGLGGDQVEGRQAVRELLLGGRRRVREVVMITELEPTPILDDIVELAQDTGVPVRRVLRRKFDSEAMTESHQGVVARAVVLPEEKLEELATQKGAFLLMLDGVTDPGNLGAILRTAECAGVTGVVLPRHRSVHITPTVTKTAAGAIEFLPLALVGGLPAAIAKLKELGVYTIGLDMGGGTSMFEAPLEDGRPVALVLGAEGKGLSRLVSERVDIVASIPMRGQLNSLNVAMAGAVACFEVVRRRELGRTAD